MSGLSNPPHSERKILEPLCLTALLNTTLHCNISKMRSALDGKFSDRTALTQRAAMVPTRRYVRSLPKADIRPFAVIRSETGEAATVGKRFSQL